MNRKSRLSMYNYLKNRDDMREVDKWRFEFIDDRDDKPNYIKNPIYYVGSKRYKCGFYLMVEIRTKNSVSKRKVSFENFRKYFDDEYGINDWQI